MFVFPTDLQTINKTILFLSGIPDIFICYYHQKRKVENGFISYADSVAHDQYTQAQSVLKATLSTILEYRIYIYISAENVILMSDCPYVLADFDLYMSAYFRWPFIIILHRDLFTYKWNLSQ